MRMNSVKFIKKITHGLSLNMGNINISTFYLNSLLTIKIWTWYFLKSKTSVIYYSLPLVYWERGGGRRRETAVFTFPLTLYTLLRIIWKSIFIFNLPLAPLPHRFIGYMSRPPPTPPPAPSSSRLSLYFARPSLQIYTNTALRIVYIKYYTDVSSIESKSTSVCVYWVEKRIMADIFVGGKSNDYLGMFPCLKLTQPAGRLADSPERSMRELTVLARQQEAG